MDQTIADHPSVERLGAFLRGELGDQPSAAIEEHLGGCPKCCDLLPTLVKQTDPFISRLRAARPPEIVRGDSETMRVDRHGSRGDEAARRSPPGFEILGELGRGGMGVVYKALQVRLNRPVALKMMLAGLHASPGELVRFRAEAEAIAQFQHPNIVQIHEIGEHDGLTYLALEFVAGGKLDARINGAPQAPTPAATLVATLARAIHAAHRRGIVHRDLKPGNILLGIEDIEPDDRRADAGAARDFGVAKVSDFGLAKWLGEDGGLSSIGGMAGTPSYMSPEQAAGRAVGPATDVYALGAILYELLTGRPPFRGISTQETLALVQAVEPVPPRQLQPRISRDLETICLNCLQKQAGQRYVTAEDLADDLQRFLGDRPIRARRPTPAEQLLRWSRRNPGIAALSGALAAVLIAVAATSLVVARQMSRLADRQARAARDAELSRRREADQRAAADDARREAQASARDAEAQRRRAEASFARARRAVGDSFTRVSENKLLDLPGLQPLRADLLRSALAFYDEFRKERGDDAALQGESLQTRLRSGRILVALGRIDDARAAFRAAAEGYERALRAHPADIDLKAGLAEALYRAALSSPHLPAESWLQGLRRPIALLEEVVADRPGEARFRKDLAGYYNQLGRRADHSVGDLIESSDALARCVMLWLELADRAPNDPDVLEGLSNALNALTVSNVFQGSLAQRTRLVRQALEIRRAALRGHPNDGNLLAGISLLTDNLARYLWAQGDRAGAVEELRAVLAFLEPKARANPAVSGPLYGYQRASEALANRLNDWDRRDEAAAVLRQAFALAESLAREHPDAAATQENFLNAVHAAAAGLADLNRPDEAVRCLMAARAALDRVPRESGDSLVGDADNRLRFAALMSKCKPELSADERAARQGLLDQAVTSLRRAAAAGWRDAARLKADATYEAIRGRSDYPALLAAAEAAVTASAPFAAARPADLDHPEPSAAAAAVSMDLRLARPGILAAIGQVQAAATRGAKGLEYLQQALRLQEQLVAERPDDVERRADLAAIQLGLGKALVDLRRIDSAIAPLESARGLYEAVRDASGAQARFRAERVATSEALGRAYSDAGRREDGAAAWNRAERELTLAIVEKPEDPQRWNERALFFIRRRRESLAAADLGRAWSLEPGPGLSGCTVLWASLVLFNGNREEYRRGCRRLLERFGRTVDVYQRLYLAITLGLGADAIDDWSRVVSMIEKAVDDPSATGASFSYHDLALPCLRAGRFEAALRALDESDRLGSNWKARTLNDPVRAIVCHRLGRHAEARSALEKARHWADENEKKGPPDLTSLDLVGDWYRHLILLREAEALILYDPVFPADPFAR